MSTAQVVWAVSLVVTLTTLPVGAIRMVIYRSGQIDHTPTLHRVAWLAVGLGSIALAVFVAMTLWFLATGQRPV